jgi:hypothetical protein
MKIINLLAIFSMIIVVGIEIQERTKGHNSKIIKVYKCADNFCYADVKINKVILNNVYITTTNKSILNKTCSLKKLRFSMLASYEYICEF